MEFFRIPRSVLTVCLGKCVTGDTRLVDADTGAYVPITEMHWGKRTLAWDGSRLKPAKVSAFVPQGKREIFELRTRAGLRIRATANHPFRMLNRWVPLGELRPGDRIAVAREIPIFGKTLIPEWEATLVGLMISEGQCNTPGHSPTYTTADPAMVALLESAMAASGRAATPGAAPCGIFPNPPILAPCAMARLRPFLFQHNHLPSCWAIKACLGSTPRAAAAY